MKSLTEKKLDALQLYYELSKRTKRLQTAYRIAKTAKNWNTAAVLREAKTRNMEYLNRLDKKIKKLSLIKTNI